MRLAVVSNLLPPEGLGGAETYVARLASDLAARHDVLVLSGSSSGVLGVGLAQLPCLPRPRARRSTPEKAVWHLRDQWLPAVHYSAVHALSAFRPDVVHTHNVEGLSPAIFTAIRRANVAHVHTAHDLYLLCVRSSMTIRGRFCGGRCAPCALHRHLRKLALRSLDCLIAPSEYIRGAHVRAGVVPAEQAWMIPQGDVSGSTQFRIRRRRARPTLGFIGQLVPHKGISLLLSAFRDAPPEWRLRVAGSGLLQPEVEARASEDSRITFHGHITGEGKEFFFDEIDVLVIPSEWEEPAPLVAIEAAARGIPSVVSDRGGLLEIPEASVFESGNPDALRSAVHRLVAGPQLLQQASGALLSQRERFSWRRHVEAVDQVLMRAVDRPARASAACPSV